MNDEAQRALTRVQRFLDNYQSIKDSAIATLTFSHEDNVSLTREDLELIHDLARSAHAQWS